jgi:hypothetical protein
VSNTDSLANRQRRKSALQFSFEVLQLRGARTRATKQRGRRCVLVRWCEGVERREA